MIGIAEDPGAEAILVGLTRDITRLPLGKVLTIAEFAVPTVTIWKVSPGTSGAPRVWYRRHDWSLLRTWGGQLNEGDLLDRVRPEDDSRIVVARTGPETPAGTEAVEEALGNARDADRAFGIVRGKYPHATAFRSASSVDELLSEATARVPLPSSLWYELVLLRRRPSGRLELTVQQLFLPEAVRGDTRAFTVRCAPGGERGTAFAVVARDAAFSFKLVSLSSARIPSGTYDVTATLLRPGLIRFDGLPATLRKDGRSWHDVRAAVPDILDVAGPAHLVVAVERCGTGNAFRARVDRAEELVKTVLADASGPVTFSLLTYASHSHDRRIDDEPVTVLAWQEADAAHLERRLAILRDRDPLPPLHPQAAQVECMLAEVARRLREHGAAAACRPVLVTIGDSSAFPHRVDPRSEILPCPRRHDWRAFFRELADDLPGMAFGAIRDDESEDDRPDDPVGDIWRRLGTDASASVGVFPVRRFAVALGLIRAIPQYLPLPFAVPEGVD